MNGNGKPAPTGVEGHESADRYFFDSYALIAVSKAAENYRRFIGASVFTGLMNAYEFMYCTSKEVGLEKASKALETIDCTYIQISLQDVGQATKFKLEHAKKRFSYVDCLGYTLAKKHAMKFLTGDREFEGLANVEFVK